MLGFRFPKRVHCLASAGTSEGGAMKLVLGEPNEAGDENCYCWASGSYAGDDIGETARK